MSLLTPSWCMMLSLSTDDVSYGYKDRSKMCGQFIGALFSYPNIPMFLSGSTPGNGSAPCPPLAHSSPTLFIALNHPDYRSCLVCLLRIVPHHSLESLVPRLTPAMCVLSQVCRILLLCVTISSLLTLGSYVVSNVRSTFSVSSPKSLTISFQLQRPIEAVRSVYWCILLVPQLPYSLSLPAFGPRFSRSTPRLLSFFRFLGLFHCSLPVG